MCLQLQFSNFTNRIFIFILFIAAEDSVKELQRKRHSANPDVSFKGRVRKAAKWKPASDDESAEEAACESAESRLFVC